MTDSVGANVVYVEAQYGELHWISGTDQGEGSDEDLGISGSAPAISSDGASLVYLGSDGRLYIYRRAPRTAARLAGESYQSFVLGGSAVFAVASDGTLVRIDTATGNVAVWLPPVPDVSSAEADIFYINPSSRDTLVWYGQPVYGYDVVPGMLLVLNGTHLRQPGWQATIGGLEATGAAVSDTVAYVQVPNVSPGRSTLAIGNPAYPMRAVLQLQVHAGGIASCFGTLHQSFDRLVSSSDPAHPGEVDHVFLTGLQGSQPVPYGVPNPADHLVPVANPPTLVDSGAANVLFFGLAPGLLGEQQADLQIVRPFSSYCLFSPCTCSPPSVSGQ